MRGVCVYVVVCVVVDVVGVVVYVCVVVFVCIIYIGVDDGDAVDGCAGRGVRDARGAGVAIVVAITEWFVVVVCVVAAGVVCVVVDGVGCGFDDVVCIAVPCLYL